MLKLAQILTANEYEASIVEQRKGRSMQDIAIGLQAVIVTRGAEGATLYADGPQNHIDSVKAKEVVDHAGCGEVPRAGLLYGLSQHGCMERARRFAYG